MSQMSEAAKQRMEDYVDSCDNQAGSFLGRHLEEIRREAYQAGMQDPEANADIIAERDSVIRGHLKHIKKLEGQIDLFLESGKKRNALLDEALKFVVCDENCNSSKGRGFRKCDCGARAMQEKIREALK